MKGMKGGDARLVIRKSPEQIAIIRTAGKLLRELFEEIGARIRPGVRDTDLERLAQMRIERMGATPLFLGYKGFPAAICCSINCEVVHGIPSGRRLQEGDIVGIDIGIRYKGFCADSAYTYPVGKISDAARRLLDVTQEALWQGIDKMRVGCRVGDVSAAIQRRAEEAGYNVVRDYTGHGIGRAMHEAPETPNFGVAGAGRRLQPGIVIALEPMINEGGSETRVREDGWTVVTADGRLSAHFEHTVAVTEGEPDVLTL